MFGEEHVPMQRLSGLFVIERRFRDMRTMTTAIFIVIFARNKWWIDLNGKTKGPYICKDGAQTEAISLASNFAKDGRRAEVQVAEPGEKRRIVYQSSDIGMLGRGRGAHQPLISLYHFAHMRAHLRAQVDVRPQRRCVRPTAASAPARGYRRRAAAWRG